MHAVQPTTLPELQRWFISAVTDSNTPQTTPFVTPGPALSAAARLQIYRDGYLARFVECLREDYPALAYALGEATFTALCHDYVAQHPSRSPSLNAYGQHLAAFCRGRAQPWAHFAADLAHLEWALVEVVHEPLRTPLTSRELASLPAAQLTRARFTPSATLRVQSYQYPINDFYQAFCNDDAPELPAPSSSALAISRSGLSLWRQPLALAAATLLQDLLSGMPLADAVTALAGTEDGAGLASKLPVWLGSFMDNGYFERVVLD